MCFGEILIEYYQKMEKKNVTIDLDRNVVWEVERVYPLEKASYWWTKPQLKAIRDDYKNHFMMEGVKNLVKARVEQEEEDIRVIEQRVEEIMELDPGSIANFLQSIPTKSERNYNLDSSNNSNSDSNSDSDSDTDSDSDSDSDSESSSSASSSSSSGKEDERKDDHFGGAESSFTATTKSESLSLSTSAAAITSEKNKSIGNQTNQLLDNEQTPDIEIGSYLQFENRKSAKNRFRQGVWAVVAMERLKTMVKRDAPPSSSMHKMLSSSNRLIDMYLPSDEEWSDEGDISECPVCLYLVDPEQQRKIILLRRMLCKGCYFSHYINRVEKYRNNDNQSLSSKRTSDEVKQHNDKLDINTKRDIQIPNSLKRCISSNQKSPMLPGLPMAKLKISDATR